MKWLQGKKTYIIGGLLAIVGIIQVITGDITLIEFLNGEELRTLLGGLGLISLRAGVEKN